MGRVVIAAYHPKEGREAELLKAIRDHVPILRSEDLATDREPIILRSKNGSLVEIFEWVSAEAISAAHSNTAVQKLWSRFEAACEYRTLSSLAEAQEMFAEFDTVELSD